MFRGLVFSFIIAIAITHDITSWAQPVGDEVVNYTDSADTQDTKISQMLFDKWRRNIRASVNRDNSEEAAEKKSGTPAVNEPEQESPTETTWEADLIPPPISDDGTVTRKVRTPQYGLLDYNDNEDYSDSRYYTQYDYKTYGRGCRGLYYGYGCGNEGQYYPDYYGSPSYNSGYRPGYLGYRPGYGGSGYRPGYGYQNSGSYAQASAGSYNNGFGPQQSAANSKAQSASFSLGPLKATFSKAQASSESQSY